MKKFETLEEENEYLKECVLNLSKYKLRFTLYQMRSRCKHKSHPQYKDYGGRGISVCEEWSGVRGFENFYDWSIKNGWEPFLTIDRINVNGNYEPDNCRWVTMREQNNNTRRNHTLTLNGETHTIAEWARINGVDPDMYYNRVRLGWTEEDILTRKKNSKKKMPH